MFIDKLMGNIHLKLYNFAATEREIDDRTVYRRQFRYHFMNKYTKKVEKAKEKIRKRVTTRQGSLENLRPDAKENKLEEI